MNAVGRRSGSRAGQESSTCVPHERVEKKRPQRSRTSEHGRSGGYTSAQGPVMSRFQAERPIPRAAAERLYAEIRGCNLLKWWTRNGLRCCVCAR